MRKVLAAGAAIVALGVAAAALGRHGNALMSVKAARPTPSATPIFSSPRHAAKDTQDDAVAAFEEEREEFSTGSGLGDAAAQESETPAPAEAAAPFGAPAPQPSAGGRGFEGAPGGAVSGPELDALRELARSQAAAEQQSLGFAGGPPAATPAPVVSLAAATVTATPTPQETPLPLVGGQARGFTMLYLMHPHARTTVERQVDTLLRANIRELYLGVLVDGTFGSDFGYLGSVVERLASAQHPLTLVLYLSNGPTMRRHDGSIDAGFDLIAPEDFRAFIRWNQQIRSQFQQIAGHAKAVFDLNKQLNQNGRNIAIVQLEDNLEHDSYKAARDLAAAVLGDGVELYRNPCLGCYAGNDNDTLGDGIESHSIDSLSELSGPIGFTFDGNGYYVVPNEGSVGNTVEPDRMVSLLSQAEGSQLSYVGLWRAQRQGIYGGDLPPPDQRVYEVPTPEMSDLEVQFLRAGLPETASEQLSPPGQ
jgi:hypothetical protein